MVTRFLKEVGLHCAHVAHHLDHHVGRAFSSGWGPELNSQFLLLEICKASLRVHWEGQVNLTYQGPDSSLPNAGPEVGPVPMEGRGKKGHWRLWWELP